MDDHTPPGGRILSRSLISLLTERADLRLRTWNTWVILSACLAFGWFIMWQATISPTLVWQDTHNYIQVASAPLWSTSFWFGKVPPLTPFLWKLTGSPEAFAISQSLISVISWCTLSLTVASSLRNRWWRTAGSLSVLAFGSSLQVSLWNRSVLSEALAMSLLALMFSTALWFIRAPTPVTAALAATVLLMAGLDRDSLVILLGLALLLSWYLLFRRKYRRLLRASCVLVATLAIALGICLYGLIYSNRTSMNSTSLFAVRVFPYPARIAWFAARGMPQAKELEHLARHTPPPATGDAEVVYPPLPEFTRLMMWVNANGYASYSLWLLANPWYLISGPFSHPQQAYNYASGNLSYYAAPNRTSSVIGAVLWPPWPLIILLAASTPIPWIVSMLRRSTQDRRSIGMALLAGAGAISALVAWQADGQEVTRHTVEGLAQLRLGVSLAWLYAWATLRVRLTHAVRQDQDVITEPQPQPAGTVPRSGPFTVVCRQVLARVRLDRQRRRRIGLDHPRPRITGRGRRHQPMALLHQHLSQRGGSE